MSRKGRRRVRGGKKNRSARFEERRRSGHITTDDSDARQHTTTATHNQSPTRAVTLPTAPSMINRLRSRFELARKWRDVPDFRAYGRNAFDDLRRMTSAEAEAFFILGDCVRMCISMDGRFQNQRGRIVFINKPSYTYDVLLDEGRLAGSVIHRTPSSAMHVGATQTGRFRALGAG